MQTPKTDNELTLPGFLATHPWPAEWLKKARPMEFFWKFDLPVSTEALWPHLTDLSSFNKRIGLPEMKFSEKNGRLQGFSVNLGIRMSWEEVPWEWEYGKEFKHARVYSEGLAYFMRAHYTFEKTGPDQCRLYVYFGWIPRGWKGRLLLSIGMNGLRKQYIRGLKEITPALKGLAMPLPPEPPPKLSQNIQGRLENIQRELMEGGISQSLAAKMLDYVKNAPEDTLYRIRVKPLAREWRAPEKEVLLAFLTATTKGLFQLTWDVICPHCRGVRHEADHLSGLPQKGTCEACQIDFDATTFNTLEVTFHVHPSLRTVRKKVYCAAEPAAKPHIKLLKTISPENRLALATLLGQGRYRLRLQGSKTYGLLDVAGAGPGEVLWKDSLRDDHLTSSYFPTLALENTSREPKTFVLEEEGVDRDALRPADLFSLQGFRDLFSKEALSSDIRLEAGVQTILFTDLVGSTRFYVKEGDTAAFTQVRRHFQTAYEKVNAHDGAIVKTIGDAVMAAFPHPVDALQAAVELQRHFNGKNPETSLRVRATLHTGSCLAVNLNSNIDYFGNTVNLTAKIQSVAGAGQIGFTENVMKDPEVSKFLAESGLKAEKLDFEMKWSGGSIPVYRVEI